MKFLRFVKFLTSNCNADSTVVVIKYNPEAIITWKKGEGEQLRKVPIYGFEPKIHVTATSYPPDAASHIVVCWQRQNGTWKNVEERDDFNDTENFDADSEE